MTVSTQEGLTGVNVNKDIFYRVMELAVICCRLRNIIMQKIWRCQKKLAVFNLAISSSITKLSNCQIKHTANFSICLWHNVIIIFPFNDTS